MDTQDDIGKLSYDLILNSIADPVFVKNDKFEFVYINAALSEILGIPRDNIIGKTLGESLPQDQMAHFLEVDKMVLDSGQENVSEESLTGKDGNILSIITKKTLYIDKKGNKFVVGIIHDDTEGQKAKEALIKSEELYRVIYESSRDAIMTLEPPTWKFTKGNPATLEMFRVKNEAEFLTCTPADLSPHNQPDGRESAEKAKEMIETAMREGSIFFEWTHKRVNGEEFPATVLLSKIVFSGQAFIQAVVRDITLQKRAEESLNKKTVELENMNKFMVGRELKMSELKKEIEVLKKTCGK